MDAVLGLEGVRATVNPCPRCGQTHEVEIKTFCWIPNSATIFESNGQTCTFEALCHYKMQPIRITVTVQ